MSMLGFRRVIGSIVSLGFAPLLLCAKPVSVDEIFTKTSQFKILGNLSYINIHHSQLDVVQMPQQNGSIISVPIHSKLHQDYLNFSLQARYGIMKRVEVFSTLNAFWQQSLFEINHSFSTQQRADFNSFALGFIIQAKQEGRFPALLLGGSVDVANKTYLSQTQSAWQYGKGYSAFALSFYTIDPLVFLLQANARFNLSQDFENIHLNLADVYSLSPMVYFAINPFVSLNAGVRYQYSTRAYMNDRIQAQSSSVGYIFGVAYEIKSRLILFASAESFNSAFYSSDTLSLMLSYRI